MAHFEAQTFHEPLCRVSALPQAVLLPRGLHCRASIAKAASEVSCVVSPEYNFLGIGMCDNQMAHPRGGTRVAQGGNKMITGYRENKKILNSSGDTLSVLYLSYPCLPFLINIPKYTGTLSATSGPKTCMILYV